MENKSMIIYKFFTTIFAITCIFFITNNGKVLAAELSQKEKEELHQQYVEILNEVKSTVQWGDSLVDIEVTPINEFKEEDWVSLEIFKQRAIDATQANAVNIENHSNEIIPFSTSYAAHTISINHGSTPVNITVSAYFTTQLSGSRQVFTGYASLSNTSSKGSFSRTGVDARIIDAGRTYTFTIGGSLSYLGLTSYHTLNTDFLCNANGVVS
ncbi:hypothetical protein P9B03_14775 [Metasolibacillus meyeri]|uniref:Uncharacterized protein n=1 Tax=Metasolibacillus meyeri TaxID=1071052 RepID=A0AAW9NQC6_9BACL|nr:hypothetical protein [Metasolibacillus meyeri]MEC1179760.1 hypothetical protein [Metasolibacillus meyeri]